MNTIHMQTKQSGRNGCFGLRRENRRYRFVYFENYSINPPTFSSLNALLLQVNRSVPVVSVICNRWVQGNHASVYPLLLPGPVDLQAFPGYLAGLGCLPRCASFWSPNRWEHNKQLVQLKISSCSARLLKSASLTAGLQDAQIRASRIVDAQIFVHVSKLRRHATNCALSFLKDTQNSLGHRLRCELEQVVLAM